MLQSTPGRVRFVSDPTMSPPGVAGVGSLPGRGFGVAAGLVLGAVVTGLEGSAVTVRPWHLP